MLVNTRQGFSAIYGHQFNYHQDGLMAEIILELRLSGDLWTQRWGF